MKTLFLGISLLFLITTAWGKPVRRDPMMNPGMFEGDMLGVRRSKDRNAIPLDSQRWPGGQIPYVISSTLDDEEREALLAGMKHISARTCIKFVEKTFEHNYVKIFKGDGCYSNWGRIGGEQDVSLGEGCHDLGTVVHELLHTVGFEHEHNRSDRDDYLVINWENIEEGYDDAFETLRPDEERLLTDFDFDSIMLYGSGAFSREPGLLTMEAKDGRFMPEVYDKKGLSPSDIKRIKKLYDCE